MSISSTSFIDKANGDEPSRNGFLQIVKVSVSNGKQTLALLNISYMVAEVKSDLQLKGHKASLNVPGVHGPGEIPNETFVAEIKAAVEGSETFKVVFHSHPKISLGSNEYNFRRLESKTLSST